MANKRSWKFWMAVLAGLFILGQLPVCFAQDQRKSDTENADLAGKMLALGQEAYERGLYEKAGYYFLQAVKINPTAMAFQWYQITGGDSGKGVRLPAPSPPAAATPGKTVDPANLGITIADDEGC